MSVRHDIGEALDLVETALGHDTVQGTPAGELIIAARILRNTRDRLTQSCVVCDDTGCPYCPKAGESSGTVIPFPPRLEVVA